MEMQLMTPDSLVMLTSCLDHATDETQFISGGTDMILKFREEGFGSAHVIDLSGINELKYIKETDEEVCIGALTTLSTLVYSDLLSQHAPMLSCAADQVGSTQIRNAATIGGNVANSFAGADLIPPLFALDAVVDTLGKKGSERSVPIRAFLTGNRKNVLESGEMIRQVRFQKKSGAQFFGKIGSRSRVTISKLNMASFIDVQGGKVVAADVAFGALGSTAFLSKRATDCLLGKNVEDIDFDQLKAALIEQVDEAIPTRQSRIYKRDAVVSLADGLIKSIQSDCEV